MFRRVVEGACFGIGLLLVWTVWSQVIGHFNSNVAEYPTVDGSVASGEPGDVRSKARLDFSELSIDKRIKEASAIAVARYVTAPDGMKKAVISEYLMRRGGVEVGYAVGEAVPDASFYPGPKTLAGDAVVIFFQGSPAAVQMTAAVEADRVIGLGYIPLDSLRQKISAISR